jgi:hypothetical protein
VIPPCFICEKKVASVFPDPPEYIYNQPYKATVFVSHGHYGSTVFDPVIGNRHLEINICDECLLERKDRVLHVRPHPPAEQEYDVRVWDPEND